MRYSRIEVALELRVQGARMPQARETQWASLRCSLRHQPAWMTLHVLVAIWLWRTDWRCLAVLINRLSATTAKSPETTPSLSVKVPVLSSSNISIITTWPRKTLRVQTDLRLGNWAELSLVARTGPPAIRVATIASWLRWPREWTPKKMLLRLPWQHPLQPLLQQLQRRKRQLNNKVKL